MSPKNENVDRVIAQIEQIPTLPIISRKVIQVAGDENAPLADLVRIIEKDQALTVKILKVANSAFYGFLSRVSSLEHALALLGANEVKAIVLASSVHDFFSDHESGSFDRTRFWKHAVISSQVARYLGSQFKIREDDSLFLAGLIHDIGKVVLDTYLHEEFLEILDRVSAQRTTFSKAEKTILGVTHYQIGAKLLRQWKFPKKVILQVLYHHAPWYDKNHASLSIVVYLANILTKAAGFSCHPEEAQPDLERLAGSPEMEFIVKNGFDLDHESLKKLLAHIRNIIMDESDNVLRIFS
jgi:putative nucleotidyltransferase with HDIG domain